MENLIQKYITEAKDGIEVDGEIINLLNKKESELIIKKHNISNQMFAQLIKAVMDYYESHIATKKASQFITDLEIKAKFPESKYIQDITVRSYLCHVMETSKGIIDDFYGDDDKIKKEAIKDLSINMAIVQLKKIYKITTLKFAKLLKKNDADTISVSEIKEIKKNLDIQIKTDTSNVIPEQIKKIIIDKNETIKSVDLKNLKQEVQKTDIKIDETAVRNVNKYLSAITETFSFLKIHFPKITLKDIKLSEKILKTEHEKESKMPTANRVFTNKIKDILNSLGHINSYSMKENFENMNELAWCYNVINLKAYHTGSGDFSPIDNETEKKVVSILVKYQPAQRNSYDAYHLVEDFIEICRDQTGEIKISHNITDLVLTQILKDHMQKAYNDVNNLLRTATKINKVKAIEVKKDESGVIQVINQDKTQKVRRTEIEKIVGELSSSVTKARKFFFDLYSGHITFNDKRWENLDKKTQVQIMKNAKIDRNSAEFLELKLNKKIEKNTGINPRDREHQLAADLESDMKAKAMTNMSTASINFITEFKKEKENYRQKYGNKLDLMIKIINNYELTGNINKKIREIFDKNDAFQYKIIEFAKAIPANGNIRNLLNDSTETPLLNKYLGILNENK